MWRHYHTGEACRVCRLHDRVAAIVSAPGAIAAPAAEPEQPDPGDGDVVPDGTIAEVLAWVGEDPARAQEAYDVEAAKTSPRTTLLADLEDLGATSPEA